MAKDFIIFKSQDRFFLRITQIYKKSEMDSNKVEIILEQREVAFLSTSKICENLNFSTEIQIFAKFCWVIRTQTLSVLKIFLLYQNPEDLGKLNFNLFGVGSWWFFFFQSLQSSRPDDTMRIFHTKCLRKQYSKKK